MPRKSIDVLTRAAGLNDDDLLPIHQQGEAKALPGSAVRQFAVQSVEGKVAEATAAAARAEAAADGLNIEQVYSVLDSKVDNWYQDPDTNLVYLTSNGLPVGDPLLIIGGSGGGGSASNNAVLTMTNTTGWIYKTVSYGSACPISIAWSSLEEGLSTGPGVLKISVNGTVRLTAEVQQGELELDISPWLSVGACTVKVNITDAYGNVRTLNFNVTAVSLLMESSFDATVPYSGEVTYSYTPTGTAEKTVYFIMDGEQIGTATISTSGRQQNFQIPAQSHGSHTFEVYFDATIDGTLVESNRLYYDLMFLEEGNTTPIISCAYRATDVEQFCNITIPYIVYDPSNLMAAVSLKVGDTVLTELEVDRTQQTWAYRPEEAGSVALAIVCGDIKKEITLNVVATEIAVKAEENNLSLYLTAYGRSNNEANPGVWNYGDIQTSFTGFNWTSDGWQQDDDGITVLRVSGDARVEIPYQMFATDFRTTGKTIEVEFATRNILDYDAPVITCFSGTHGLQITAQRAWLKSEGSEIGTQYKEDEHVRLAFVVEKRTDHRLLLVYINGILSGATRYPADDDFSQADPVGISIGSNDCTTDIYNIRIYDNNLTRYQVLDNWIADTQIASLKAERFERNNIYDDYGKIVIGKLPQDLPYLVLHAARLPEAKGDKVTVTGSYTDLMNPAKSFSIDSAEADVQGTSSAGYARKNYKIKFKSGFSHGGTVSETYQLGNSIPTNVFTFKADVASSEGANNVELVKLYDDICPYRIPRQVEDIRVRQGIDGYPIVIFQDDGADVTFIGKYNFNHDKGTPEVFGFDDDDESWEIRNNTSNRVIWKSADYTGTDWLNDFEGRHPDGNTDPSNLSALANWLMSTDTEAATGEALSEAVTYDGVEYTADTAEYRLAKFSAELGDWMEEESAIFYYLFTELFLMVDSRAKNAFPTRYDGGKWCWLPYDMDTALGINNEGALAFGYELEDIDQVGTADVYNGQQSVMWKNLRATRFAEIQAMYQKLRTDGVLSYDEVNSRFENHQAKWPEAIFNEDAYYKYLEPLFNEGTSAYLSMLQGSKAEQRKWWLYNRFRYMDSKYNAGDAVKDYITLRGYAKSNITITPYAHIYASIKYGSYLVQTRALRGTSYTLECPLDVVNDTETYIYSASQLSDIGDLSGYKVGYAEFSMGTKLSKIKLGDSASDYSNPNLNELGLGNNVLLRTLDIRNCPNMGTGEQKTVDLSGCTNIEEVYCDGTAIGGVNLPNGGILRVLHLPDTVTNLTIRNQIKLAEFVMPGYSNVTTLRLENMGDVVPARDILASMASGSRVRLIGFDWSFDSNTDLQEFYDRLETMRGLDENGNNTDKAQVAGTVRVDKIPESQLSRIQSNYPNITVIYSEITPAYYKAILENTLSGVYVNDSVVTIMPYMFSDCVGLTSVSFGLVETVGDRAFESCKNLQKADFAVATSLGTLTFWGCSSLSALILRNTETVCTIPATGAIANATVYVPKVMLEQYHADSVWGTITSRVLAIEDYPEITGGEVA